MSEIWIVGAAATRFTKWPDRSFRDLSAQVVRGALADLGLPQGDALPAPLRSAHFGNCAMGTWGQANVRGQVALAPLLKDGTLPAWLPIFNVEAGCATGSLALHSARNALAAQPGFALALGVEKTFRPSDPASMLELFTHGIDRLHPEEWQQLQASEAASRGLTFAPHPHRVVFLDVHALRGLDHMQRYGTTREQLAQVASKNHHHGSLNPRAQLRFELSPQQVLDDKPITPPLTRAMCCPMSDGAAAALLCDADTLERLPRATQERAVRLQASVMVGGRERGLRDDSLTHEAARQLWERTGMGPEHIQLAELHDATAFCELEASEALGFCDAGQGGPYAASGATSLGGERPINTSGGLESCGHPLGATGLGMVFELVQQLRGEAGARQVQGAHTALAHNAGGMIGLEEALCALTLLQAAAG